MSFFIFCGVSFTQVTFSAYLHACRRRPRSLSTSSIPDGVSRAAFRMIRSTVMGRKSSYQRRYFVLTGSKLAYYRTMDAGAPAGEIDLTVVILFWGVDRPLCHQSHDSQLPLLLSFSFPFSFFLCGCCCCCGYCYCSLVPAVLRDGCGDADAAGSDERGGELSRGRPAFLARPARPRAPLHHRCGGRGGDGQLGARAAASSQGLSKWQ